MQPDATITNSDCPCATGTHDGSYPFLGSFEIGNDTYFRWGGYSTCYLGYDDIEGPVYAYVTIALSCIDDHWVLVVTFYVYDVAYVQMVEGQIDDPSITVDADGNIHWAGSVTVTSLPIGTITCSVYVTLGGG